MQDLRLSMMKSSPPANAQPTTGDSVELSLVLPCYNEEACLERTVPPLAEAFANAGIHIELVLVDNGSRDRTSAIIESLIARGLPVTKGTVPVNRGQGLGLLTGFRLARGRYIGYLCADGQVAAESVVSIYRCLEAAPGPAMAKARRRFRQDSWIRKIVSICYNATMLLVFPGMPSIDVNGNPKILPADILHLMELDSQDWFLEAEIMLKARHLRLMVYEIDVPGFARAGGRSSVRLSTMLEFVRNIIAHRFGGTSREWRRRVAAAAFYPTTAAARRN